ncbi:S8 family peptidase [Janthinobacterium sp. GB1R12]|uniref:S8 family peptidase n=1 Tax=Janthinobacterium sp. GB1R12 TaxID=3424190 RepID=UPI003F26D01F
MVAVPVQAAPKAPPSWALHNNGGLISVDLDQMQAYRIQAVAGQDIGWPGPRPAAARKVITVAILDTGIDARHPAFADQIASGTDANSADTNSSPQLRDTDGSGTHLAGIVASISQDIVIMPLQVLQRGSNAPIKPYHLDAMSEKWGMDTVPVQGLSERVAAAIYSLAEKRVQVMLLPFGWPRTASTDPVATAIAAAQASGVLVVTAAGNDASTTLPLPCQLTAVICVAASRPDGAIADFSNFGPGVDIAAPGVEIPGPLPAGRRSIRQPGNIYDNRSGTSQAAAMVTGAVALLLSHGIPAADVYPRLVLGARPMLPETRLIEGPFNLSGHPIDSLGTDEKPLRSGQLDIAAALALRPRTLILPANKDSHAIAWDGAARTVELEIGLKNVWKASPAARFEITIHPAAADPALPSATIERATFHGDWPAQQERRFHVRLRLADTGRTGQRVPADLRYTVTVSINGVAQPGFDICVTLNRYVDKTMRDPQLTTYPISGSVEPGMHLHRIEQSDLDRNPHSYLALGTDPANPRALRVGLANFSDDTLVLPVPVSVAIDGLFERCHLQQQMKLDVDFDGKSEYILYLTEDSPATPIGSQPRPHAAHLLVLDAQMQLLSYQKIQDERFTTPTQFRWMRLGNAMRPAWITEDERVRGPVASHFYYLNNDFRVQRLALDPTLHLFPFYLPETYTGRIPLLFAVRETPCVSNFCSDLLQLGIAEEGKFQRDAQMNNTEFRFFSDTLSGPLLDPAHGKHIAGLYWYARDAHHTLRISLFNQGMHYFDQRLIAATRAALDIPIAVTGAFQSERQSAVFVNTVQDLQYHDLKTGQIATTKLNAYSFLGEHRYLPQQFPIVIQDLSEVVEGRPGLLIAAGQGEYRIALPVLTQAGKGNRITSPARWHLRSTADCQALEEPVFLTARAVYAMDFFCGDRLLRIAFAD